jgi:peroxiredoxin
MAEDISPLLIGENIPEVILTAPDGTTHSLLSIISEKPTIILFYRGGWCPYCNSHLSDIEKVETDILELGYQIIAISPDSPENLQQTTEKDTLNYSLYSDGNGAIAIKFGIAFKAPEKYSDMLVKRSKGLNTGFLPVPSVFVIDNSGKILFEYINPDYKIRLKSGLLIAVLKNL